MVAGLAPDLLPAELIDHDAERPPDPLPGASAAYGKYLVFMCAVCHAEDLSGGPGAGEGMNLTPGGQLAGWSEEDFIQTIRTGVAPDGVRLDDEEMPWRILGRFSDQEFRAIWLYLQSLPAIETEHR
jgi:mono/diheme cytochrome c family protein